MNRLDEIFSGQPKQLLNIYFTAGFPSLDSTELIIKSLADSGADLVEIGIPYSDPIADGPTIQHSSAVSLTNGMSVKLMFEQVALARKQVDIPFILMGYLNQVMQFGVENFLQLCQTSGVDGLIVPDLPLEVYEKEYKDLFENYGIRISFLVTPQSGDERIKKADRLSSGFLYVVSSASITGAKSSIGSNQKDYFERLQNLALSSPKMIGFGISNAETFQTACQYAEGAIIGSAFINMLNNSKNIDEDIQVFVKSVKG